MSSIEVYTVSCRRCDTSCRIPGWDAAAEAAHRHAEHGGAVNIRRIWLRTASPRLAAAT